MRFTLTKQIYDKVDGHKLLVTAILMAASLFVVVPFVPNVWGQGAVWFSIGICTGSADTGANTLIVWAWKEKVTPFMQLLHFSFGVGAFLSPVIVAALQESSLFKQYLALSIPYALSAIPLFLIKSPTNTPIVEVQLQDISKQNLISDTKSVTASGVEGEFSIEGRVPENEKVAAVSPAIARRMRIEVVAFAALLLLLDVGAEIGFGGWIFTYAHEQLHFSDKDAAYVTAVFWGTFTLGRLAAVGISLILSPKTMLFADTIGCSLCLLILILFPKSSVVLWLSCILFGFSIASVFPTVISLPQTLGIQITGSDTSWMVVGASTGEMVVPMMIGLLQDKYSMTILIVVVLIVEVMGGATFAVLLLRVSYLKGELGSFFGCNKERKMGKDGKSFKQLDEDTSPEIN